MYHSRSFREFPAKRCDQFSGIGSSSLIALASEWLSALLSYSFHHSSSDSVELIYGCDGVVGKTCASWKGGQFFKVLLSHTRDLRIGSSAANLPDTLHCGFHGLLGLVSA